MVKKILLVSLFFFIFIFFTTPVQAFTYTNIGYWNDYVDYGQFWFDPIPGSGERYIILEPNQFVGNHSFSFSNVYSMDLYLDNIPSELQAQAGIVYELELSMTNAKFQNVNQVYIRPTVNGSMQCSIISFDNSSPDYPKVRFTCPSSYSSIQLSMYSSSLQSIFTTTSLRINYLYLRQYESGGTDTSVLEGQNQVIINQNDTIINNQNQNTQDIINNQNQNTQLEIESQKVCKTIDKKSVVSNGFLADNDGNVRPSDLNGVTDFLPTFDTTLKILLKRSSTNNLCFYSENKSFISCINTTSLSLNSFITFPPNSYYFRATIRYDENKPQFEYCINGNQALSDDINALNDTLNDTSQPNTNQDINDMNNMVASDTPISDLITMPLTLINAYINGVNSTCSPVNLGNLYGTDLILPCINLEQRFGTNLWRIIDAFFSIFMCYNIGMLFVSAFDGLTSLRDDFEGLYQPRHADTGYQPKHGG